MKKNIIIIVLISALLLIISSIVSIVFFYKESDSNKGSYSGNKLPEAEKRPLSAEGALIEEINLQKLTNGFERNVVKQATAVYDPKRNKVYASGGLNSTNLAIINPETDTVEEIIDMKWPGGIMTYSKSGLVYIMVSGGLCTKFNPDTRTAERLTDMNECQAAMDDSDYGVNHKMNWNGYELVQDTVYDSKKYNGYPTDATQDLNGAYDKIKIMSNGVGKGFIIHGPDALHFDIDTKHGKLYASNTGCSSISVFDLNKLKDTNYCENDSCWIKDISLGKSIDEILTDSSGNIYIRNRLGGSTIYKYTASTKSISLFADNENNLSRKKAIWNSNNWNGGGLSMWPIGFALRKDEKEMYVLSHYNASIDILDTATGKLLDKFKFDLPLKPRTDTLSSMTFDAENNRAFAVFAEEGIIGVADLSNKSIIKMIDLSVFGFDKSKAANKSFGLVQSAYNQKTNKLDIYFSDLKKLIQLNGTTFEKEQELSIDAVLFAARLVANPDKQEIYVGNKIIDSSNFRIKSSLTLPDITVFDSRRVENPIFLNIVGFDNSDNSIYADKVTKNESMLYVHSLYKFVNGQAMKQLSIGSGLVIPAQYYFDTSKSIVYAYFMGEAIIKKYDFTKFPDYTDSDFDKDQNNRTNFTEPSSSPSVAPINQPKQGLCGDGICDEFEKKSNKCSKDCQSF